MSILFSNSGMSNITVEADTSIGHDSSELMDIMVESTEDICKVQGALLVMDIALEQASLNGEDVEPLMENAVKGFFEKVWEKIKAAWAKVKGWFQAVYKYIKTFFLTGEKFIKYRDKDINAKASNASKFEFEMYDYDMDKFESECVKIGEKNSKTFDAFGNRLTEISKANMSKLTMSDEQIKEFEEKKDDAIKHLSGFETIEDYKKHLQEVGRGGTDTKKFVGFGSMSIKTLKELTSEYKKGEKLLKAIEKRINDGYAQAIKSIEEAKSAAEKKEVPAGNSIKAMTLLIFFMQKSQLVATATSGVSKSLIVESGKSAERVLKSLLRYRPAKEGFYGDFDDEAVSESSIVDFDHMMKFL